MNNNLKTLKIFNVYWENKISLQLLRATLQSQSLIFTLNFWILLKDKPTFIKYKPICINLHIILEACIKKYLTLKCFEFKL